MHVGNSRWSRSLRLWLIQILDGTIYGKKLRLCTFRLKYDIVFFRETETTSPCSGSTSTNNVTSSSCQSTTVSAVCPASRPVIGSHLYHDDATVRYSPTCVYVVVARVNQFPSPALSPAHFNRRQTDTIFLQNPHFHSTRDSRCVSYRPASVRDQRDGEDLSLFCHNWLMTTSDWSSRDVKWVVMHI